MVEPSGKVKVATGLTTQGQGHFTSFAQIVADELGVPLEDVEVVTGDTRRFGYAVGTFASRAAVMSGNAIALAARKVRAKALRIAGDALEADPGDLEIVDGVVRVKGIAGGVDPAAPRSPCCPTRCATPSTRRPRRRPSSPVRRRLAGRRCAEGEEPGLEGTDYYSPIQATFANGMHAAIVETDPETGRDPRRCATASCTTAAPLINPMIVEGQVHGGVAQGVGGALYERMVYDENGQLLNASFMDFLMPYASEVPTIEIDHLETPSPLNPLGIKGAGEAGVIPSAAVFAVGDRGRRGLPDHRDADLAERAVRAAPPPRRRGDPDAAPPTMGARSEGHRFGHPQRPARPGLGGPQRPRRPGAHDPRLPAAGGGRSRTPTG